MINYPGHSMQSLLTQFVGLALMAVFSLPSQAARCASDACIASEPAAQVVDVEVAGFIMSE
jgi:hypothetical protein